MATCGRTPIEYTWATYWLGIARQPFIRAGEREGEGAKKDSHTYALGGLSQWYNRVSLTAAYSGVGVRAS